MYATIRDKSFNETFDSDSIRSGVYSKIHKKKKRDKQVTSQPPESIWMTIQRKDQEDQKIVGTEMSGIESHLYENVQNLNLDKGSIGTGVYSKIDKAKKKKRPAVYSLPPENLDEMYAKVNKSSKET